MKRKLLLIILVVISSIVAKKSFSQVKGYEFRELEYTEIENAPKFKQPKFLTDENGDPIYVEKYGMLAPYVCDWNGDKKMDLIIGDFFKKNEDSKDSNLHVHLNVGKKRSPKFSSERLTVKDKNGDALYVPTY